MHVMTVPGRDLSFFVIIGFGHATHMSRYIDLPGKIYTLDVNGYHADFWVGIIIFLLLRLHSYV